ncbi:hypothetical protein GGR52DRAFT_545282 [Hypoxylon sp. FL1284]|nr:hypothetical protein GGR52DRAFT_545282 [Hypoxylon sp. FL1284]
MAETSSCEFLNSAPLAWLLFLFPCLFFFFSIHKRPLAAAAFQTGSAGEWPRRAYRSAWAVACCLLGLHLLSCLLCLIKGTADK